MTASDPSDGGYDRLESFRLHDADTTVTRSELAANLRESGEVFEKHLDRVHGFGCSEWAGARFVRTYEQRAEYYGTEPAGQSATFTATAICRLDGDRIAELWVNNDDLGVLEQLGVVTVPPEERDEENGKAEDEERADDD